MYNFSYDPNKKQLPYYDRFPLCIPVQPYTDGFGMNLHYIAPNIKAQF